MGNGREMNREEVEESEKRKRYQKNTINIEQEHYKRGSDLGLLGEKKGEVIEQLHQI